MTVLGLQVKQCKQKEFKNTAQLLSFELKAKVSLSQASKQM